MSQFVSHSPPILGSLDPQFGSNPPQYTSHLPPINTKIVAEYIWLDSNMNFRSKSRVLKLVISHKPRNQLLTTYHNAVLLQIPDWNYDGSSTGQATTEDSEVILKPCKGSSCAVCVR